jgi:hypothetical protein
MPLVIRAVARFFLIRRVRYPLVLAVFVLSAVRCVAQDSTYTSPTGFYSLTYPKDWTVSSAENDKNTVNITPPGASGAVTISAFHGPLAPEHPRQLVERTFKQFQVVSALHPTGGDKLKAIEGEFLQVEGTEARVWLARVETRGQVLVFITASDLESAMKTRRTLYTRILDSLRLTDPDAH